MLSTRVTTSRRRQPRRVMAGLALATAVALTACTAQTPTPNPSQSADTPERAAAALAAGLAAKDLSPLEFVGASGAEVNDLFKPVVAGMGPLKPAITVGAVNTQGSSATAVLSYSWAFPGVNQAWTYDSQAQLVNEGGRWKTSWQPNVVEPQLDGTNRLTQRRLDPDRGELLDGDGDSIVTLRPVVRIGIDKSQVSAEEAKTSATRLAKLVKINAKTYATKVADAGSQDFVAAIVFRATAKDRPANKTVFAIPGALPIEDEQMLAPNRDFARSVIGTVGDATKEIVDASSGSVVAGDQVGLSGLEKRYDSQLRGTPGVQVQLVPAKTAGNASASPSPTPSTSTTTKPVALFEVKPTAGKPLTTTLNIDLQKLAESTLAKTKPAASIVAIQPSSGKILAAANGPGAKDQALATTGQFPPGSTFKLVSALALLRAGLKPSSPVTCPKTVSVDGRRFKNFDDYPSSQRGKIDLRTALAQSCNTAFIGQRGKISGSDLKTAAGSLGLGTDYDVGFSSFFGAVPDNPSGTAEAAAMIGQSTVQASPMVMASVVASISAGKTVVPHLVKGQQASPTTKPLTSAEAKQLREMMRAVVTQGSGRVLRSVEPPSVIAKTGTAEYGNDDPLDTHVWMVAAQGDLAVAVFVHDGKSGSQTAGPLLKKFLAGAR
jgi:cell division protein FtsI/penicillin-binding protein 2